MRSTFKVLFYLKRDKQKANGLIPLYCRITVDGQEVRFGMKCDVNPKCWEVKTGKATGRTAEAIKINALADNTKAAIFKIYRELQERDNYVTAEKIKNVFLGIEQKQQTLLELFDYHSKERKEMIGINICPAAYDAYFKVRKQVADFLMYKYNLHDIPAKEVNYQFVGDFEAYLYSHYNYAQNTVITILKKFRHIIELGINKDWIIKNPFREYKLRWQDVPRGFLTQEEIDTLIDFRFEKTYLEKTRDIFIFCAFTGLSYKDVKNLSYDNIQSSFEGKLWIKGRRKKTDVEYKIPLLNIPKMIMEKYRGTAKDNLVLPVYHAIIYNKHLKEMAKVCGITKRMSSHLARHTFATLTLTQGVSIESVSKMLGHSNINTTQIYSKVTENKVGNEMNAFAGNVRKWDAKLQPVSGQEEIGIDSVIKSLKIPTGKAADVLWENLIAKVWNKLSNIDKQIFASEIKDREDRPGTLRDFYVSLMDYFLDTVKSDDSGISETAGTNMETKFAINF
jgi:site-specific recombinase XerD